MAVPLERPERQSNRPMYPGMSLVDLLVMSSVEESM